MSTEKKHLKIKEGDSAIILRADGTMAFEVVDGVEGRKLTEYEQLMGAIFARMKNDHDWCQDTVDWMVKKLSKIVDGKVQEAVLQEHTQKAIDEGASDMPSTIQV